MQVFTLLLWVHLVNPANIQFKSENLNIDSNSGYIQLEWNVKSEVETYVLQQATDSNFADAKVIYQGPDQASFVSGLNNNTYYYRVGDLQQNWSSTLRLNVKHQSLSLAYTLFILGFVVFAGTIFIVIKGVKTTSASS